MKCAYNLGREKESMISKEGLTLKVYNLTNEDYKEKAENFLLDEIEEGNLFQIGEAGFAILIKDFIDLCIWPRKGKTDLSRKLYGFNRNSHFQELPRDANPGKSIQRDIILFEKKSWEKNSIKNIKKYWGDFYKLK
jgi:hypothetical protein